MFRCAGPDGWPRRLASVLPAVPFRRHACLALSRPERPVDGKHQALDPAEAALVGVQVGAPHDAGGDMGAGLPEILAQNAEIVGRGQVFLLGLVGWRIMRAGRKS